MSVVSDRVTALVPSQWWQRSHELLSRVFEDDRRLLALCLTPALALYVLVAILPMVWAFNLSLYEVSTLNPVWEWTGPGRLLDIVASGTFQAAFGRSLVFGFGSVAFQIVVGVSLALLVNREFKGAVLARALALLPYMVPAVAIGMVGQFMLNAQYGIINLVLIRVGILNNPVAFLGLPETAMATVMVVGSWKFAVFVTLLTLARLQSIPENFYEGATMCGANAYQKFRDVTLPRIKNVILIAALLRTLWMFNKFDIIYIMTRGGPGETTTTIPLHAYEVAFNQYRLGEAAGIAALMFVFLALWSIVYFRVARPEEEVRVA
ncbi:carbohydrate ABC transporter permease [Halolamina rubra]|uniref:carbohydrate ABC transporter permease n=1 Tax=Halolamina rubra TaxID=1380430 RepID=UPI000679C0CD|nr:sugar ABC transporter permease [Halolamina rubra]